MPYIKPPTQHTRKRPQAARNADIIRRRLAGARGTDLAREYGVTRQYVAWLVANHKAKERYIGC